MESDSEFSSTLPDIADKVKLADRMVQDKEVRDSSTASISKIFDGRTTKGRAHVAMATYAVIGGIIFYFMTRPPRPPSEAKKEQDIDCVKFNSYNVPPTKI